MRTISQLLLSIVLNAAWQIALISAFAALCSWMLRESQARYRHTVWVAALVLAFSLPVLTSFRSFPPVSVSSGSHEVAVELPGRNVTPEDLSGPATTEPMQPSSSSIQLGSRFAAALLFLYVLVVLFSATKLLLAWRRTRAITLSARRMESNEQLSAIVDNCRSALRVEQVDVFSSASVAVPITFGVRAPAIILPEKLIHANDRNLLLSAIGHELIHVLRRDYVFNLLYEFIYLPLSFHPAAGLIRRRISQTRELCCDELVAEKLQKAEVYARSLVQLANEAPRPGRLALTTTVGIADADNLEVRVMSLLKGSKLNVRRKRLMLFAALMLLAVPCVTAAAFALRVNIDPIGFAQEPGSEQEEKKLKPIYRPQPEYPEDARAAKVEGAVKLLISVDTNGHVQDVQVTKPLFPSLDRSAVEAVRRWRFAPFVVNGEPKPWRFAIEVRFDLETSLLDEKLREEKEAREREELERQKLGMATVEFSGDEYAARLKRRNEELEARAKTQVELASHARISMDQALQIANSKYPGTVWECNLVAERWEAPGVLAKDAQVFYHVVIVTPNSPNAGPTHVWVSAIDGRILKTEREERQNEEARLPRSEREPVTGGVLNGNAVSLPSPEYPSIARAAGAEGTVTVAVTVDEEGNVIAAKAISGHPLLQAAAVRASREAKFAPTRLEGEPIKVKGVLTYNFVRE